MQQGSKVQQQEVRAAGRLQMGQAARRVRQQEQRRRLVRAQLARGHSSSTSRERKGQWEEGLDTV